MEHWVKVLVLVVLLLPSLAGCRVRHYTFNLVAEDVDILKGLGFAAKLPKEPVLKYCYWVPPSMGHIKANTDGASGGNPGPAGIGISYRDSEGNFLGIVYEGIGISSNFWAESMAIVVAAEIAIERGWFSLWIESDSSATVSAFTSGNIPWQLRTRWIKCKTIIQTLVVTHIWREANLVADQASKLGVMFQNGFRYVLDNKPAWINSWEVPYGVYNRIS